MDRIKRIVSRYFRIFEFLPVLHVDAGRAAMMWVLMTMALEAGCLFSIDSDAHAPGQLDFLAYGCERAQRLGVPVERIVNTWEVDRLLAWARP